MEDRVDLAVHSMKDVPTEFPDGLTMAAICKRQDVRDALLSNSGASLAGLPSGARVGTSSLRRKSQLLHVRNDLQILENFAGMSIPNRKTKSGDYDAIVLAKAGLDRLGLSANISEVLSTEVSLPAAGQGAIGIESRADDKETLEILAKLNDAETRSGVEAERVALASLEGGCQASIGAWGRVDGGNSRSMSRCFLPRATKIVRKKLWRAARRGSVGRSDSQQSCSNAELQLCWSAKAVKRQHERGQATGRKAHCGDSCSRAGARVEGAIGEPGGNGFVVSRG